MSPKGNGGKARGRQVSLIFRDLRKRFHDHSRKRQLRFKIEKLLQVNQSKGTLWNDRGTTCRRQSHFGQRP